jgi:hypothetical protein
VSLLMLAVVALFVSATWLSCKDAPNRAKSQALRRHEPSPLTPHVGATKLLRPVCGI